MDIYEVLQYLPHRYPFLLVDKVLSCLPGERLVALKNVTVNEPFFPGHFPGRPVMPGVLMIEALAQAMGILAFKTADTSPASGITFYLAAVDKVRFKRPVEPGDTLIMTVSLERHRRDMWMFSGEATVDGQPAVSAKITCARRDVPA
ncbi:MAG TPA: 3-hydroxyacyl-ACP dehydratase FabZ [Gammaproteobacteria bacterium]|nr:3-hydroxyacyl-ACP dehydratase FabZ [Gammaproteobacteria bacterium]